MNTIQYLKDNYGYGVPIFLKNIRIGGKSKTAIRQDLSRAVKNGEIYREENGVYYFSDNKKLWPDVLTFDQIIKQKYVKEDFGFENLNLNIFGYYSGQTFLNSIGISQQVPAVIEVTTNNTSCKRIVSFGGRRAIIRKGRTTITRNNYKALQFLDLITTLDDEEIEANKELLINYVKSSLFKNDLTENIKFYPIKTSKILFERGFINEAR